MRFLVLAVVGLLAGCAAAPGGGSDDDGPAAARGAFVDPIVEDHEHTALAEHALATPNFERLAYTALGESGAVFTSFGELDVHGDVAAVAAQQVPGTGVVLIVDVADPTAPALLGAAPIRDPGHPLDVKWDEAGEFVFASGTNQIYAFDARDRAAPELRGTMLPQGAACHMTAVGVVDGTEYLFCTGDPTFLTVYRIVAPTPDARVLVPVGESPPASGPKPDGSPTWALGAPHDMTFQLDPVDGTPILVVSNRNHGVRVLDVSNPARPVELGGWAGEGAEFWAPHVHTAMVFMVDGVRVLGATPEILPEGQPPALWLLDATDYAAMTLMAEWTAPGNHPSPGFTFTTHQWQVVDGRIYLAYYHAGVWVLDVRAILAGAWKDDPARPEVLAYHLPHEPPVGAGADAFAPNVWDVVVKDGYVYATDISSGLYVLHYAPDALGDAAISGFA